MAKSNPRKCADLFAVVLFLALNLAMETNPAFSQEKVVPPVDSRPIQPETCAMIDDCQVPYEYLASEETDPYLVFGQPPIKRSDIRAAKRWPNVRSCLIREESIAKQPDISRIDWGRMKLPEDLDVCMFRIFSSINSVKSTKLWFTENGLADARIYVHKIGQQRYLQLRATNKPKETQFKFLGRFQQEPSFFLPQIYLESFSVRWTLDGRLYSTHFSSSSI